MTIYEEHGFSCRKCYLANLADEFGVPEDVVIALAELLGPDEDFDGLISALEDYESLQETMGDDI